MCCPGRLPAAILNKEESQYYSCFRSFNVLFFPLLNVAQVTKTGLRTDKSRDGSTVLKLSYTSTASGDVCTTSFDTVCHQIERPSIHWDACFWIAWDDFTLLSNSEVSSVQIFSKWHIVILNFCSCCWSPQQCGIATSHPSVCHMNSEKEHSKALKKKKNPFKASGLYNLSLLQW